VMGGDVVRVADLGIGGINFLGDLDRPLMVQMVFERHSSGT
jgi:hypothetical protein